MDAGASTSPAQVSEADGEAVSSFNGSEQAAAWDGVEEGVVWGYCSGGTVSLAVIDPDDGSVTDEVSVALPDGARTICAGAPAAVPRHSFNADFTSIAVEVTDPQTRSSAVGIVDIATGRYTQISVVPESDFAGVTQDVNPTFDMDPETDRVWYQSREDHHLWHYDVAAGTRTDRNEGEGEVDTYINPFLCNSFAGTFNCRYAPGELYGGLISPSSLATFLQDYNVSTDYVHALTSDGEITAGLFCNGEDCIRSTDTTGQKYTPNLEAAAWIDDYRVLAFDDTVEPGVYNVELVEFDEDFSSVTVSLAMPEADWGYVWAVVSPDQDAFAVLSVRGDQRVLFRQELGSPDAQPMKLLDVPRGTILAWL